MCGAVKFTATPKGNTMSACHCEMCRRWTGGVFLSVSCSDITFPDDADLIVFKSSKWAERVSCAVCGASLAWRMQDRRFEAVALPAFPTPDMFTFDSELFIDNKPDNYAFANATRQLTEAEVLAEIAPSEGSN
jgi:hypothetical protein